MTIEEILAGESKNVEFKENLPEKSIKYMKSVVAFANGTGGKIIFGIADKTREVVGFDKENVFKKMDAIANAVSDSCEPAIIPDITLQTVEGKTVIVVEVSEGRQRPYYIKALGRDGGVYVRVAGTTRLADEYMIKELMFEGSNRYFDQALCTGLNITDEDIDDLCKVMKEQAVKNAHNEEQKAAIKDVGRQQQRSWGILIERQVDGTVDLNDVNNTIKVPDKTETVPDTTEKMPDSEQEQQIYKYVSGNGPITAAETAELLEVKPRRARAVLLNMVRESYLKKEGAARSTIYEKNTKRR